MAPDPDPTVLVVDDDPLLTDMYAAWLSDSYRVVTANDGASARRSIDDGIDAALLDRQMPDTSGSDLLAEMRARDVAVPVAMVSAVTPDVDVIGMGFDDYLVKPVTEGELVDLVASLFERASYDDSFREYFALAAKRAVLESSLARDQLESNEEYAALESRLAVAEHEARSSLDRLLDREQFPFTPRR